MINLLVVSGSPVDQSSTDIILQRISDAIVDSIHGQDSVASTFVKLNELKFAGCQSCGEAPSPGFCLLYDDLTKVYARLAACDCLLFGTPVYFDSVSAQAKMFIDRCNCFRPPNYARAGSNHRFLKILKRKRPGAMVLVGGERGWFEGARRVVAGFFKWVEVTNEGMLIYRSRDFTRAGTVVNDSQTLSRADALGRRLAEMIIKDHGRS